MLRNKYAFYILIIIPFTNIPSPASGMNISATSYINTLDGPYNNYSYKPGTSVSASASSGSATSSSSASSSAQLAASSSSENMGLPLNAVGSASYQSVFNITGNKNNIALPLTFNFQVDGNLGSSSAAGDPGSLSLGYIDYSIKTSQTSSSSRFGIESQGGIPHILSDNGNFNGSIIPTVNINANIGGSIYILNSPILKDLGIDLSLTKSLTLSQNDNQAYSNITSQITTSIFKLGIPSLNLPGGIKATIEFDVNYQFNGTSTLNAEVKSNYDVLMISLFSFSTANSGAKAYSTYSGYSNTYNLSSVTIPYDFTGIDTSQLKINFESGLSMPILRSAPNPTPVPIPGTLFLMGSAIIGLWAVCKKQKSKDCQP